MNFESENNTQYAIISFKILQATHHKQQLYGLLPPI